MANTLTPVRQVIRSGITTPLSGPFPTYAGRKKTWTGVYKITFDGGADLHVPLGPALGGIKRIEAYSINLEAANGVSCVVKIDLTLKAIRFYFAEETGAEGAGALVQAANQATLNTLLQSMVPGGANPDKPVLHISLTGF